MKQSRVHLPSIQGRFITIIIATVIPFLLLLLYWIYENSQENWKEAQSRVQLMAQVIGLNLDRGFPPTSVSGSIDWAPFRGQLDHFEWPSGFTSMVCDERGVIVFQYPTSDGWVGKTIGGLRLSALDRPALDTSDLHEQMLEGRYWGLARFKQGHWTVLAGLPTAAIYADTWSDTKRNLFFMVLITLSVLGLARVWSRRITMPIRQLAQHMQGVKAGDLPAHIQVTSRDETQLLAENFNIMATRIRERDAEKAQLFDRLVHHQRELESLSAQLLRLQEEERRRVARELHDEIGQALGAITINLQVAERVIDHDVPRALDHIADAKGISRHARQEIDRITHDLRPSALDDFGLVAALRWYASDFTKRTGIPVKLETEGIEGRLPSDVEVVCYRMVQEALTNSHKHAEATEVSIVLSRGESSWLLLVEDNGRGFPADEHAASPAAGGRLGLVGIRERAAGLGATFEIHSSPDSGTTLKLEVPRS